MPKELCSNKLRCVHWHFPKLYYMVLFSIYQNAYKQTVGGKYCTCLILLGEILNVVMILTPTWLLPTSKCSFDSACSPEEITVNIFHGNAFTESSPLESKGNTLWDSKWDYHLHNETGSAKRKPSCVIPWGYQKAQSKSSLQFLYISIIESLWAYWHEVTGRLTYTIVVLQQCLSETFVVP